MNEENIVISFINTKSNCLNLNLIFNFLKQITALTISTRIERTVVTTTIPIDLYPSRSTGNIGNLYIYYLIFLFGTVSSYFVSYKFSLVNAEQKNYIFSNINTLVLLFSTIIQILNLILFKSFLGYLLIGTVIGLAQQIFVSKYLNKRYPYLIDKNVQKLSKEELQPIKKNVFALIYHKIGEVSVYQTDNVIISAFINITTVGLISNYNLIITAVNGFIGTIFASAIGSLGNLVAIETKQRQIEIFNIYNFVDFWLYGFSCIAFVSLIEPFITLWIGSDKLVDSTSLILICLNFYFVGQRVAFLNFKTAFGVFYDDKYVVLGVAAINLVISITMVKLIGLPGVYIGTLVSGLYSSIRRPLIAYKRMTGLEVSCYFKTFIKYLLSVLAAGIPLYIFSKYYLNNVSVGKFTLTVFLVALVPNLLFYILYRNAPEFEYCKNLIIDWRKKLNVEKK